MVPAIEKLPWHDVQAFPGRMVEPLPPVHVIPLVQTTRVAPPLPPDPPDPPDPPLPPVPAPPLPPAPPPPPFAPQFSAGVPLATQADISATSDTGTGASGLGGIGD